MSKWSLSNHITGKTYDLTQENMSAMISDVEMLHTDSLQNYRESLESYKRCIKTLQEENARLIDALEKISIMTGSQKLALSSISFVVGLIVGLCMSRYR